jgi:hypothetical protein
VVVFSRTLIKQKHIYTLMPVSHGHSYVQQDFTPSQNEEEEKEMAFIY